ncbi:hypothetical protein [Salipiger sp.]|uniref:hypothetical protein n=1 Tax=Salipiger sp. TaxID=2078585 RepID=UPI003A97300E
MAGALFLLVLRVAIASCVYNAMRLIPTYYEQTRLRRSALFGAVLFAALLPVELIAALLR